MGIVHRSNNRVLPANARAVDVAKSALNRIAPVQARRHDAAFQVGGYQGVLYNRMTSGYRCRCTNHSEIASSRLGVDGKADSGLISSLLTGGEFGIRPYGAVASTTQQSREHMLEIVPLGYRLANLQPNQVSPPSLYEMDYDPAISPIAGTMTDLYSTDPTDPSATSIVEPGTVGPNGPVETSEEILVHETDGRHNPGGLGYTDAACPVCFGSGYVGGYSVHMGWRRVFVPYEPTAVIPADATLDLVSTLPSLECDSCEWTDVRLPVGLIGIDSLKVYHDDKVVTASLFVDNVEIVSDDTFRAFCDGRPHTLRVSLTSRGFFSHFELQLNQSSSGVNFEFPRLSKNANMGLLERTDPFQVVLSPLVPLVKTLDILMESSTGKFFQVMECTSWNDNRARILGWSATVRATQPQEIFSILPKRRPLQSPSVVTHVRDNSTGKHRT